MNKFKIYDILHRSAVIGLVGLSLIGFTGLSLQLGTYFFVQRPARLRERESELLQSNGNSSN